MPMKCLKFSCALAGAVLLCSTAKAQIKITDFKVEYPGKGTMKVTVSAEGSDDVRVGSYAVCLIEVLPHRKIWPQKLRGLTWDPQGNYYVYSNDFGKPDPSLKDNGPKDEDPREGVFAITIDGSKWPVGKYFFIVAAMNRPAAGTYYEDRQMASLTIGNPVLKGGSSNVKDAEEVVVYRKEGVYVCFPGLTQLADGRLITTFATRARVSHVDPVGGSAELVSSDGGQTWSPTNEPVINPAWKTRDGTFVKALADGWIYVPRSQKDKLDQEQRITMIANDRDAAYLGGAHSSVSTDGKTWTDRKIDIPDDIAGLMNHSMDAMETVTKNGVRLVAIYGRRKNHPRYEVFFLRSADDGKTWTFVEMLPGGFDVPDFGLSETTIATMPNGDVLAMCRPDPADSIHGDLYASISRDDGLTWSKPKKTGIWGYPADLLVLPDGRVLCAYGYRRSPMGIRACLSHDNGQTWDIKNEMILRADGLASSIGDLGYPLLALRPDGKVFCIYYIVTDGVMPYIGGTIFSLPRKK